MLTLHLWSVIARHLDGTDVANLECSCRILREMLGRAEVWNVLSRKRWRTQLSSEHVGKAYYRWRTETEREWRDLLERYSCQLSEVSAFWRNCGK